MLPLLDIFSRNFDYFYFGHPLAALIVKDKLKGNPDFGDMETLHETS